MQIISNAVRNSKAILLITFITALTGCASAPQAPVTLNLDTGPEKTYTFRNSFEDGRKLTAQNINGLVADVLESEIYRLTGYQHFGVTRISTVNDVRGVETTKLPNAVKMSYSNGAKYKDGYVEATRSTVLFGYSLTDGANTITLKLTPPKQIVTQIVKSPLQISYDQFASNEQLISDVTKIYAGIDPKLTGIKSYQGEVNSSYGVDAISANFKRGCGSAPTQLQPEFKCRINNANVRLQIMPYKAGSKVTYEFEILYALTNQGGSTYSPETGKAIIASIEKIVKD